MVPSLHARATVEKQEKEYTDGGDPLFIGYSAAVYFHTCDIDINSRTTQAEKMNGSAPPKFEVRGILRTLEQAKLEKKLPIWDDGRMIVEKEHIALTDEMRFATRKYRASYGLEQLVMKQEEKKLDAAGPLYLAPTEYKKLESMDGESMDETLSEAGEEMEVVNAPDQDPAEKEFTTHELLQDLSGDDWANTTSPAPGSPRKIWNCP